MILLDTNICIYVINERPATVLEKFKQFDLGELGMSSIVASELAFGIEKTKSTKNLAALELFLAPFEIFPFDERCVWHYSTLRAALEEAGKPIGTMDTLIAAHALALDAPLVTNNLKEFSRVPGLRLLNWVEN